MNAQKIVDILLEEEEEDFNAYFMAALTPEEAYWMAITHPELRRFIETVIAKSSSYALSYALKIYGPFPAGEPAIATDADCSYHYATEVLKGKPFPLGEPAIATSPLWSSWYANDVLNGPFPLGEPVIATDYEQSYDYATRALKGERFPAGEAELAKNAEFAYLYAKNVLGDRFHEAEAVIARYPSVRLDYNRLFGTNI